jgi:GNAT superfamily N-acetyltransferase
MAGSFSTERALEIHPLTPKRWGDFEKLFGKNGACAGCWCMWWRLPRSQWRAQKGEGNKRALREIVSDGNVPGLLAYLGNEPAGWCAFAPRETYPGLARSRILKPIDEQPVWSITCFFVARAFRRNGLTVRLLEAAAAFARENGATILEGYPVEPKKDQPDAFVYTGLASAFRKAGFKEVGRRSASRPIFRRVLNVGHRKLRPVEP